MDEFLEDLVARLNGRPVKLTLDIGALPDDEDDDEDDDDLDQEDEDDDESDDDESDDDDDATRNPNA